MRVGVKVSNQQARIQTLTDSWRRLDDLGADHLWVMDHLAPPFGDPRDGILEAWTLLAAMSQVTARARLGVMVTANTYRHPSVLSKMATTVDHLSGGRLELGMGAAWVEPEHRAFGLPFGRAAERIRQLDEACQVLKLLWTGEPVSYAGQHYQLSDATACPRPLQQPFPPLWIGGAGPNLTLRVVARHADAWNIYQDIPIPRFRYLSDLLAGYCAEIGRDPAGIRKTREVRVRKGRESQALAAVAESAEAGFDDVILLVPAASATELITSVCGPAIELARSPVTS